MNLKPNNYNKTTGKACIALFCVLISACDSDSGSAASDNSNQSELSTNSASSDCIDQNSSNSVWSDNCVLSQSSPYATSSYTRGIQRILWCQGLDDGTTAMEEFADGVYGTTTAQAVREFQDMAGLNITGVVESNTWAALRDQLEADEFSLTGDGYDGYIVLGCEDLGDLFFQQSADNNQIPEESLGWSMIKEPGDEEIVEFSITPR